ncbi:MAG: hypothetical protein V3S29_13085 [bacterium]
MVGKKIGGAPAALLAATLVAALAVLGAARPGPAEAREFPTEFALGFLQPIGSDEGQSSPLILLDHRSRGHYGRGSLTAKLRTTRLRIGMRHPLGEALAWQYAAQGEVISLGNGADIYLGGDHLGGKTFSGDGLSAILGGHLFPESPWRAKLELERMTTRFAATGETAAATVLPTEFNQTEWRLHLTRRGMLGEGKAELTLKIEAGSRQGLNNWALDDDAAAHAEFTRTALLWQQPVHWSPTQKSSWKFFAGSGENLDLFSGYRIGGFSGILPIAGYFRNEFRAREARVLNFRHDWAFAKDRVLTFFFDAAGLSELELAYNPDAPASRNISGVGVGFRYGLRSLAGLPLVFRYGHGLDVPGDSLESHRQEFAVAIAAGF